MDAQSSAAAAREAELSEELRQARQAAARAAYTGEDHVIAMEKAMRGKHEREVAELQTRASESEERVRVGLRSAWRGCAGGVRDEGEWGLLQCLVKVHRLALIQQGLIVEFLSLMEWWLPSHSSMAVG